MELLKGAGRAALDFLLPLYCVGCRREGRGLCRECLAGISELRAYCKMCAQPGPARLCRRCSVTPLPMNGIRAVYQFEGAIRSCRPRSQISQLPRPGSAARRFDGPPAWRLHRFLPACWFPVPMHPRRERSRGYNQAELLANELAKMTGVFQWEKDVLNRLVGTPAASPAWNPGGPHGNSRRRFRCFSKRRG